MNRLLRSILLLFAGSAIVWQVTGCKSVNKVILLGHVGKDPEIRTTNGGTLVANLSLATTDRYKDSHGESQDRTEWHNLAAYARGAEILRDYVKKGSKLYIKAN